MGKGKEKSHSKSDCTYFKEKEKENHIFHIGLTPLTCFPNSHRSKVAMHRERATRGKCFCENSAEIPDWKGVDVVVKEKSCCFLFFNVGRETDNNAITRHSY